MPLLREFGFQNILLGTLDYAMPDELEVDDDFMMYLRDHGIDMTGGFAFTDIGLVDASGGFTPSPSMRKLPRLPRAEHAARDLSQPGGHEAASTTSRRCSAACRERSRGCTSTSAATTAASRAS